MSYYTVNYSFSHLETPERSFKNISVGQNKNHYHSFITPLLLSGSLFENKIKKLNQKTSYNEEVVNM